MPHFPPALPHGSFDELLPEVFLLTGMIPDSSAIVFDTHKVPEAILHLRRHGGILITCDSFQNMLGPDVYFNEHATETKRRLGFFNKAVIGPGWRKFAEPKKQDFERISELRFNLLLTGHGEPLLEGAYQAVASSIDGFKV